MSVTAQVFTLWQTHLGKGGTNGAWTNAAGWTGDTIKCALIGTTGAANVITNRDTYDNWSSVSAQELAASGNYSAGGVTLTSLSIGAVISSHKIPFIATIPAWTSATFTAYAAVVYNTNSPTSANAMICSIDFGAAQTVASGTFTITADASAGVWNLAAS